MALLIHLTVRLATGSEAYLRFPLPNACMKWKYAARQLSLSWARSIQSIPPHPTCKPVPVSMSTGCRRRNGLQYGGWLFFHAPYHIPSHLASVRTKVVVFRHAVTTFAHKWRSHRSRYVLPSFSDRSQHIAIVRALPSIVTFQYATVCTEMVSCVSFDSSVQYRWLDLCTVWDKVISNWCHLTIWTAMCVLHRRKLNFTQLYWTGGEQLGYCV